MKGPFFLAGDLLRVGIPRINAHMHTGLTDGKGVPEDFVREAKALGLTDIAFTEHMDDTSVWFDDYIASRSRLRSLAAPMRVHLAGEIKVADPDGRLNISPERLKKLDFVVGVLHRYPDGRGGYHAFRDLSPAEAQEKDFNLSLALLKNPLVDVWGHPAGVYAHYFGPYDRDRLEHLVKTAADNGKVVELNTNARYRCVFPVILKKCLELNCVVSLGSDAHDVSELGLAAEVMKKALAAYEN